MHVVVAFIGMPMGGLAYAWRSCRPAAAPSRAQEPPPLRCMWS